MKNPSIAMKRFAFFAILLLSTLNEEPLSLNNSSQEVNRYDELNYNLQLSLEEELNAEPNDNNFFVDQHELSPLNHNDESEIDYSTDENEDNESIEQMGSELHPFTHILAKDAIFEFLQLIRASQISKRESEKFLSFIKSLLPFPNQIPKDMNRLFIGLGTTNHFNKKAICILCEKEFENNQQFYNECNGISIVKSTNLKLWICDASLIELPPAIRTKRSNIFLISMYIGYTEPNVKTWLRSSFENINALKTADFQVESLQKSFKIKVYGCIADSPALKLMANMIGHNGYYPCFYCHIKGEHVRQVSKRQYQYEVLVHYRTIKSFSINSKEAQLNNKKVLGHLGTSILDEVLDIPLPHGLIIDYSHVSLLRHFRDVVKTISLSLAPVIRENIDISLRAQVIHHFFNRKLRGVADFSFIKAIELENLLFYGFIPHFMHYITIDQLSFISLFVIGVRLLHADDACDTITRNNASAAARNISAALGEGAVADRTCRDWFKRFREGDMSLEDRPRSGHPLESNIERFKVLIEDNTRLTTHELSAMLGCNQSTIDRHLRKMEKVNKLGTWVPHQLTSDNV
ncbi:unnamed protein product [Rotaria sp. Silwood1]|nr:unnamed protein product [Rotaria sp. Silwood1]